MMRPLTPQKARGNSRRERQKHLAGCNGGRAFHFVLLYRVFP